MPIITPVPTLPLLMALVLCAPTMAQGETKPGPESKDIKKAASENPNAQTSGDEAGAGIDAGGVVSEEPTDPTGAPSHPEGSGLCSGLLSLKPRRLGPSQSGEIVVVVMLTRAGNAVVLPGAHAKLELHPAEDSPFVFGTPKLDAAEPGQMQTKFAGQPVYDDSLIFRVPVTVKNDAKPEKRTVTGFVELAMTNGKTAQPLGTFRTQVSGLAKIGKPLPIAAVPPRTKKAGSAGDAEANATATGPAKPTSPNATAPQGENGGRGSLETPTAVGFDAEGSDPAGLQAEVDDGLDLAIWGGGLLALLVLGLLLFRRRT